MDRKPTGAPIAARLHRWLGLALLLPVMLIGVTGSVLVWRDAIGRIAAPAIGAGLLPAERYVAAARERLGAAVHVANLVLPESDGDPVTVTGEDGRLLRLDPATARPIATTSRSGGSMRLLHRLHATLLLPTGGSAVVGWIGLALTVAALSGLWLWRPARGKRRGATRLHLTAGPWMALPLAMMGLTGAWIAFPATFALLTGEAPRLAATRPPPPSRPLAHPALSPAQVIRAARAVAPRDRLRTIVWPTATHADWTLAYAGWPMRMVTVADDSGTAAAVPDRGPPVARLMRRLHDGTAMGGPWRAFLTLTGLAPLLLGTTGLLMWLRRRPARGGVADRRR